MDDSMRRTAVNLGLVGKRLDNVRSTALKASQQTLKIGVNAKELVDMYGSFSDEVGRTVSLSNEAAQSFARMAKSTALGNDGAAQFAANMELMGMSIEQSSKYALDVVKSSSKIGVNSGKVIKTLNRDFKRLQTYNFKGGVEGMKQMVIQSTKLRADMGSALSFARDLWEPEKAIEAAASLQMLGGEFAKMASPIELMFDARNDPTKLVTDLAKAASSLVQSDMSIPPMEMQKLAHFAELTNTSIEEVVEKARAFKKQDMIASALNPNLTKEQTEIITGIAEIGKGGKITIDGKVINAATMTGDMVQDMIDAQKTAENQAEQAQSFMTRVRQTIESLKMLSMRFFMGLEKGLRPLIEQFVGDGGLMKFGDQMEKLGENFGNFITTVGVPFIQGAIPLIKQGIGMLTEYLGVMNKFIAEKVIPIAKGVMEKLAGFWEENKTMIMDTLGAIGSLSKVVWSFLRGLHSIFGGKGVLVALLLIKFPSILKGLIGGFRTMLGGMGSMFGSRGTYGNPMVVTSVGGGMLGGGGPMDMMGGRNMGAFGRLGRRGPGRYGTRLMTRMLGRRGASSVIGRGLGGGINMLSRGGAGLTRMFMGGARGTAGAMGARGAMGIGGRLARGMSAGGPLALLGVGAEVGRMFMDDPDSTMGKTLGVLGTTASDAAMGMMIGSMLGPLGTAVGGIIGGIIGFGRSMYREMTTKGKKDFDMEGAKSKIGRHSISTASTSFMADGALMPDGNVIKTAKGKMYRLAPRDVGVFGQRGSFGSSYGGGGGTSNVNITIDGTIMLAGGGSSTKLDSLVNDPVFQKEVTQIVVEKGFKKNDTY